MQQYIILALLVVLTMTGAVLEGLVENLPQLLVQINGALTIVSAITLIGWTLRLQSSAP